MLRLTKMHWLCVELFMRGLKKESWYVFKFKLGYIFKQVITQFSIWRPLRLFRTEISTILLSYKPQMWHLNLDFADLQKKLGVNSKNQLFNKSYQIVKTNENKMVIKTCKDSKTDLRTVIRNTVHDLRNLFIYVNE